MEVNDCLSLYFFPQSFCHYSFAELILAALLVYNESC